MEREVLLMKLDMSPNEATISRLEHLELVVRRIGVQDLLLTIESDILNSNLIFRNEENLLLNDV
jgi:hypothetical protein